VQGDWKKLHSNQLRAAGVEQMKIIAYNVVNLLQEKKRIGKP
jgi:hypothetical protein